MPRPKKRLMLTISVDTVSPHEFDGVLRQVREKIDSLIEEYGPDAKLDWDRYHTDMYEHEASPRFTVNMQREENDGEYKLRLDKEAKADALQLQTDRKELERLQAKLLKSKKVQK